MSMVPLLRTLNSKFKKIPTVACQSVLSTRSVHTTKPPKRKYEHCYYEVDHKTDTSFVLCSKNKEHKQAQRHNVEFRLKQRFYYMGLRDLGVPPKMINVRINDLGYANFTKQRKKGREILRNNHVWDGLKEFAEETRKLQPKPGQLPLKGGPENV